MFARLFALLFILVLVGTSLIGYTLVGAESSLAPSPPSAVCRPTDYHNLLSTQDSVQPVSAGLNTLPFGSRLNNGCLGRECSIVD